MQVATNAHPSPWRYRGYRLSDRYPSYLFRSPRPFLSVESTQIRPIRRSLSLSWIFERPFEEGTTRVVTGWPRRLRVEEKSDRDAQFPLVALALPSPPPIEVCPTNELTSAIHQIDRSGNGCALCETWRLRGDFIIESYIGITCDAIERW